MKRLVSCILSVVLVLGLFPAMQIFAEGTVIYNRDLTQYSSIEEIDNWNATSDSYVSVQMSDDGLQMLQTDSKLLNGSTRNTASAGVVRGGMVAEPVTDEENRTVLTTSALRGKFDINIRYKANVDRLENLTLEDGTSTPIQGYYNLLIGAARNPKNPGGLAGQSLILRIDNKLIQILNDTSAASSTMNNSIRSSVDNTNGGEHTITISFDTDNATQTVTVDGDTSKQSTGPMPETYAYDYINAIQITGLQRMNVGAYFTFEEITVTQQTYDSKMQAIMEQLPEKLADDVNAVTENLTLPAIDGVTWKSDNTSSISDTGVVTRFNQDIDVTMTASFDGGEKAYTMTVLKDENGGEDPDLPPEPTNKLILNEETYTSVGSLEQWYYNSSDKATVTVEDGGIVIRATDGVPNLADGSLNSAFTIDLGKTFRAAIDTDDENGTDILTDGFTGKYALEFTYKSNMTTHRHAVGNVNLLNNTYYFITFGYRAPGSEVGTITDEYADLRLPGYSSAMNAAPTRHRAYFYHATNASGTKTAYQFNSSDYEQETTLRLVFDTVNRSIDGYQKNSAGEFELVLEDVPFIYNTGTSGIFNAMRIRCQEAFDVGSYIKISNVKLYEVLPDTTDDRYTTGMERIKQMPESLVNDHTNVTERSIALPEDTGGSKITWTTGNATILGVDGSVNPWVDTANSWLMGRISCSSPSDTQKQPINYYKRYNLRIPAIAGAESREVYTGAYEADDWTFGSLSGTADGHYTTHSNGLTLVKDTASDPIAYRNERSYYAVQRFKGVEQEYNDSSHAALYTDAFSGIYDLDFNVNTSICSADRPAIVDVGYYNSGNNQFKVIAGLEFYNALTNLWTRSSAETNVTTEIGGGSKETHYKIRLDTQQQKIWVYENDVMITDSIGIPYYNPLGSRQFINAFRISLDKNMESGDTIKISDVSLTQKMSNRVAEKSALLSAAQNLTIGTITDTPDAVSGYIKELPASISGYNIRWTSSDPGMIDVNTGDVLGGQTDNDVWLTAEIYDAAAENPISVYKEFKLTVPAGSTSDVLRYKLNHLELSDYTKQSLDALYYNINLPKDLMGSSLTWTSSKTDVLSNDGKIVAGILKEPVQVTLKATISENGQSVSKDFAVTVAPRGREQVLYSGAGPQFTVGGIENAAVRGNVWLTLNKGTKNGTVSVLGENGASALTLDIDSDSPDVLKVLIMPDTKLCAIFDGSGNVLEEGIPMPETIQAISAVNYDADVLKGIEVSGDTFTLLKTAMEYIPYDVPAAITENQQFPADPVMGAALKWSTDRSDVLTDAGVLTVPDVYTFVNITCTLTADGISVQKVMNVPVPCSQDSDLLMNGKISASSSVLSGHPLANAVDGDADTYAEVNFGSNGSYIMADLGSALNFNTVYIAQPAVNIKDYHIDYSNDGKTWQTAYTGSLENMRAGLAVFPVVQARYVRLYVTSAAKRTLRISALEAYLHAEQSQMEQLELDNIKLSTDYLLSGSITLPQKGIYGSDITWSSSNESILSSKGVYKRPTNNTQITLTATMPSGLVRKFQLYAQGANGGTGPSTAGGSSGGGGIGNINSTIVATPNMPINAQGGYQHDMIFNDITEEQWVYPYVSDLKKRGIVSGDGTGNFRPEQHVTREEFVKMLALAAELPAADRVADFADMQAGEWYFAPVMSAYSAGIITGISDTIFGIGTNITRQDMAVMLWRVLRNAGQEYETSAAAFEDDSAVSDYAKEAVYAMRDAGILSGYNNRFAPQDDLTRAEAAKVISVLITLLAE